MTTHDMHRPTPEFRDHLDRELTRALRRQSHAATETIEAIGDLSHDLSRPTARQRQQQSRRWLSVAAVALMSVALGTTAGLASAQMRDGARRDSLLEAARADAALVALRL